MKELSYVMIKPEFANKAEVRAEILKRLENAGLEIIEQEMITYSAEDAKAHYVEHVGKDFYPELESYITSDVAYGMIVGGATASKPKWNTKSHKSSFISLISSNKNLLTP